MADHEQQSGIGIGGCLPRKRGVKASITKLACNAGLCARCMPALLELMKSSCSLPTQVMSAKAFFTGLVGISLLLFGCRRHEEGEGQQPGEYKIGEFYGSQLYIARSATTNGCRIAWAAEKRDKMTVLVDGKEGPMFDSIGKDSIIFSPNGKRVAYLARGGDKRFVVLDGILGRKFDAVVDHSLTFSRDSLHFAYAGKEAAKWSVVVDGSSGPEFDRIAKDGFMFGGDSGRCAYIAGT